MRTAHRLRKMERALTPSEAVVAWLVAAHRYPSQEDYVRSLIGPPDQPAPLDTMIDLVEASTRRRHAGRLHGEVARAVHRAVGDTLVLYHLVLGINAEARRMTEDLGPRLLLIRKGLDHARVEHRPGSARDGVPGSRGSWASAALDLQTTMRIEEEVRHRFEHHYFKGHALLFPAVAEGWLGAREHVDLLVRLAGHRPVRRTRTRGKPMAGPPQPAGEELEARVGARAREVLDDARMEALAALGHGDAARRIAAGRLRSRPPVAPSG